MKRQNSVCVLDIGSTKICCCIANISDDIEIIGLGYCACTGIVAGVIVEMNSVCKSIATAIEMAETQAKTRVTSAYVSISGKNIRSYIEKYEYHIGGRLINKYDIVHMLQQDNTLSGHEVVLHKIPVIFNIDGLSDIKSPLGMIANDLCAQVCVITAPRAQVDNLFVCLSKCHVDIKGIIEAHYASGLALIDENTENESINLIEVGGSTTAVSFWYNSAFCGMQIVPLGGAHITDELTKELGVSYADAERLKVLYGAAIPASYENDGGVLTAVIDENDSIRMQQISKYSVNQIVQPCIEKLVDIVKKTIDSSKFRNFSKGTIITGGGSQFPGFSDILALKMQKSVIRRFISDIKQPDGSIFTPNYATTVGLLKYVLQLRKDEQDEKKNTRKWLGLERIMRVFENIIGKFRM